MSREPRGTTTLSVVSLVVCTVVLASAACSSLNFLRAIAMSNMSPPCTVLHAKVTSSPAQRTRSGVVAAQSLIGSLVCSLGVPAEDFCAACDLWIHSRKKNKTHTRELMELEPEPELEPVPCDSDPAHEAVMYCEGQHTAQPNTTHSATEHRTQRDTTPHTARPNTAQGGKERAAAHTSIARLHCAANADCEENMCFDCDFAMHSRKKTANHLRFEGARRPEDVEALRLEAEAEAAERAAAAQQQAAHAANNTVTQPAGAGVGAGAGESSRSYAAAAASSSSSAASSVPASASSSSSSAVAASSSSSSAPPADALANLSLSPSSAAVPVGEKKKKGKSKLQAPGQDGSAASAGPSAEQRAAEHKSAWEERRKYLCKTKYSVGHWLGLTTADRSELARTLCEELLFNPQPTSSASVVIGKPAKKSSAVVTVEWAVQTFWISYEVHVTCTKTTHDLKRQRTTVTVYRAHVDDMGRLATYDISVDGDTGCSIM